MVPWQGVGLQLAFLDTSTETVADTFREAASPMYDDCNADLRGFMIVSSFGNEESKLTVWTIEPADACPMSIPLPRA